jgi:pimeloyl-ACP methyl ester carboxylesterase
MEIDWTFEGTWPHPPRWFDTPDGRLHYVDVGPRAGRPIVLVHGNPSWGYLFRHFIPPLCAAGYRAIVPDHLGFGRSDKPPGAARYRVERHAARLAQLLDALDLRSATIVPHDWGGPIALAWAADHADRVARLAILDSFVHPPDAPVSLPLPLRLFRLPGLGELLVKGGHAIVRGFLLGGGVARPERLTAAVRRAYLAPHGGWAARTAILTLAREFPAGPDGRVAAFQAGVQRRAAALASRPVFIAWGGKDVVLGESVLARWRRDFPRADLLRLPEAGHFVQEDAHEVVVPALLAFLARST